MSGPQFTRRAVDAAKAAAVFVLMVAGLCCGIGAAFVFFRAVFPKRDEAEKAELAAALRDHRDAIQRTFAIPKLWDAITAREALKAEYAQRLADIEAKYHPDENLFGTECLPDPMRRVA